MIDKNNAFKWFKWRWLHREEDLKWKTTSSGRQLQNNIVESQDQSRISQQPLDKLTPILSLTLFSSVVGGGGSKVNLVFIFGPRQKFGSLDLDLDQAEQLN